jgi:hypothetical protein
VTHNAPSPSHDPPPHDAEALAAKLAPVLARARFAPPSDEARALERALVDAVGAPEVRCFDEEGDVVVRAKGAELRLYRQAVTGFWLSAGALCPERAAKELARALCVTPGARA